MGTSPDNYPTYVHRALELFAEYGEREALIRRDRRLSYADLRQSVLELAAVLREHGIGSGTAVLILVARPFEAPALQLALHLLGARSIWIDLGALRRDLPEYVRLTGPEVLIYDARTHDELGRELAGKLDLPALCLGSGGLGSDLLAPRATPAEHDFGPVAGEPSSIFQTSGTTGVPKLIHHTQSFYRQVIVLAEELVASGERGVRHLSVSGLTYLAGQVSALLYLFSGGMLYLLERFDADEFLGTIERERINSTFVAPPMLYAVLDHPKLATTDTGSLTLFSVGAAPALLPRLRQAIARFGPVLRITYGLSECPFIAANPGLADDPARPDLLRSCGRPYGDVLVEIRGEDGTVRPDGEVGELWVASAQNFAGYWGQPELTARTLVDGWLRTHDLGYRDTEGYLYLVGRNQDMIIAGSVGVKIYPRPIEDVLATHPRVRMAAVVGAPDDDFGEAAHAYVVTAPGAEVTAGELADLVRAELADWWVPAAFHFVDSLPLTPTGKIDTAALRDHRASAIKLSAGSPRRP